MGHGAQLTGHAAWGAGASGAQAASARQAHSRMQRAAFVRRVNRPTPMWFVLLEMGVALGLLILIVWWTWPKKRKPGDE